MRREGARPFSFPVIVIQLDVLSGSKAGARWVAPGLPVRVGREREASLSLPDDGVWEGHLEITVRPGVGCVVTAGGGGLSLVNGTPITEPVRLRSGDLLEAGSVKLRFGLSATRPSAMAMRDLLTWLAIGLLCVGQLVAIYFFLP